MKQPSIPVINGTYDSEGVTNLRHTSESVMCDLFSEDELKQNYMFGIDLSDSQGNPFPRSIIIHHLNAAISYVERTLGIQIVESEETELHDFNQNDYLNWGYLQLFKCPAIEVLDLRLTHGNDDGMVIPKEWIQLNKKTSQVTIFPRSGSSGSLIIGANGGLIGMQGRLSYAPQLWRVTYKAGLDEIPADLYEAIYKKATIGVLQLWGDLIIGAGIASQSVSIDGFSQSIGTTQSAMYGGASARCEEYRKDLDKRLLPTLKSYYTGLKMAVL